MNLEPAMHEDKEAMNRPIDAEEPIEIEFIDQDDEAEDTEGGAPAATSEGAEQPVAEGGDGDLLEAEVERMREMYLRKLAEFDNFRKRTERERDELKNLATEDLIRELLPVIDNFDRAIQHAGDSDPESFRQGVEMISRQLVDLLQKEGLEELDPKGGRFDPEVHEAVDRVENSEDEPGTVVSVLVKGYTLRGRLVRPAMVSVAVGPVTPSGSAESETGSATDEGVNS
jgi:molecular chaperone GrpE